MEESENKRKIIKILFPQPLPTPEDLEKKYPARKLIDGTMITRIAPSPTGFMHIGSLYTALISERLAHQTGGVFYLRIEDTDKKREISGVSNLIAQALEHYGIKIDEGETASGFEIGQYGPYKQSQRVKIYQTYIKFLLEKNLAYPCFSTNQELEEMRDMQESKSVRPGYYKQWAKWRDRSDEEVLNALKEGKKFVIRFKSGGDFDNKILIQDILLGKRELPENDQDIVIMKSNGLPTYHLAHVVDDHLMGTTHVIRGNEWFPSLPLHLQLFASMRWQPPQYGHIFPIQKMEGQSKRKLSKRKDHEANISYYEKQGYPTDAVMEYLLNLANSNFEEWRKHNPDENNRKFKLTFEKLSSSNGPLFDFNKLNDISKEIIARYSSEEVYCKCLDWAKKYDHQFAETMEKNLDYMKKILNIERRGGTNVRKDIGKWSNIKKEVEYFFDTDFNMTIDDIAQKLPGINPEDINNIVDSFIKSYNESDSKDEWFEKIKKISRAYGYADSIKIFKENPNKYKGNVADIAKIFRVLLTGRTQTPDLYSIMLVLGKDRVLKKLSVFK